MEERHVRRGSNQSIESNSGESSTDSRKQAQEAAATIDLIQNLKPDKFAACREESEEEMPAYVRSSLVERKPIASNMRHLESESPLIATTNHRHYYLPSLTPSASLIGSSEAHKRQRMLSDAESSVITPVYQNVSAGASLETIQSLVRADPAAVGRHNGGGFTPLHCAIERYDTPVSVIMFILQSHPASAAHRCARGFNPIDLLWKRYVEPDCFRSEQVKEQALNLRSIMKEAVSLDDKELTKIVDDQSSSITSLRQARANAYIQNTQELRDFWDMMSTFILAACHGETSRYNLRMTRLVHDAVTIDCNALLIQFVASLFPEQLTEQNELSGKVPLHIAASQGNQHNLQILLDLQPQAASIQDSNGQLPLNLGIQANLPWEGALELLVAAWPHSLTVEDPTSGLLPAISANECSTDVIFHLIHANPVEVCRFALERLNA